MSVQIMFFSCPIVSKLSTQTLLCFNKSNSIGVKSDDLGNHLMLALRAFSKSGNLGYPSSIFWDVVWVSPPFYSQ